jgi:hypothetical protein
MSSEPSTVARALLTADSGADATTSSARAAAAVEQVWGKLGTHFARLIGDAGIQAVLARSVTIVRVRAPWIDGTSSLRSAFEAQSVETCVEAFGDLFTTFTALLGRFIGDALVMRLLSEVWPTVFPSVPKELP